MQGEWQRGRRRVALEELRYATTGDVRRPKTERRLALSIVRGKEAKRRSRPALWMLRLAERVGEKR